MNFPNFIRWFRKAEVSVEEKILKDLKANDKYDLGKVWQDQSLDDIGKLDHLFLILLKVLKQEGIPIDKLSKEDLIRELHGLVSNYNSLLQRTKSAQIAEIESMGIEEWFMQFSSHVKKLDAVLGKITKNGGTPVKRFSRRTFLKATGAATIGLMANTMGHGTYRPAVYLTIDDGPTPLMDKYIDYFMQNSIKAVFFCEGRYLKNYKNTAIRAIKLGFVIGSHSYSHPQFSKITAKEGYNQIKKTDEIINQIYEEAGVKRDLKLFRFPYGDYGGRNQKSYISLLSESGYSIWGWTKDTFDHLKPRPEKMREYLGNLKENEVVLLHDHPYTYNNLLPSICGCIQSQGFRTKIPSANSPTGIIWNS